MPESFDLIVIGSGPGGYVAAIRASQLGLRTAVVEKDAKLGGTCLHRGCIPTKAMLHTAAMLDEIRSADKLGIDVPDAVLDLEKTHAYKDGVVDGNAKGIEFLFKKNKITWLRGFGSLTAPNRVRVASEEGETEFEAKHVLVATGSVPREIPIAPSDGQHVIHSDHALQLRAVPESLVVLGAGAVGTEFASVYRSFGSKVTLVEMLPRLLPIEDEEVSAELGKAFRKRGIEALVDTKLESVDHEDGGVTLQLSSKGDEVTLEAEMLLVAVGRAPVTENLGLEDVGVKTDRGYIEVDEWMRTTVDGVYAIGDVVNTPWLAHVASAEGIAAVEHMAGHEGARPVDYRLVPSCTYCVPEVASVGLTEAQAREQGYDVAIGKFPFTALGKAKILRHTEGFVKIVRETKYDEVLGVHIIGAHATDLIAEACVALQVESTTEELFRTMHAHPTLSESVMEAAHAAYGHAIHF
ncbi:MAG: dihydrolipoyl dehydrogenase [Thermoanaerobaculia bacterium]|nr:dihydrolipoyl dehydrogenase [Thermoanaerobaculia bacterium]